MRDMPSPGNYGILQGASLSSQSIPRHPCFTAQLPVSSDPSNKRKRRPAGTPDPEAEVVALSPKTLMESDRYVCEICNQGFQRDQNLQMHRRRHKVPWKLLKRTTPEVHKRVFVCPEPTCLHHDPCHALGDLVGIKKHFRRKHSSNKQWKCDKCSKGYAVQSDYKAHLKTCGTRGHSCACGRVFSRVESFIEHQDNCSEAKEKVTPGYSDQSYLPSISARTSGSSRSMNTFGGPRSTLSSAGCFRAFDCGGFEPNNVQTEQQRELPLLPSKQQDLEAGPSRIIMNPANVASSTSRSERAAFPISKPHVVHSAGDESSHPTLQLSIGPCNESNLGDSSYDRVEFPAFDKEFQGKASEASKVSPGSQLMGVLDRGFEDAAYSKNSAQPAHKVPNVASHTEININLSGNDGNESNASHKILWTGHTTSAFGTLAQLDRAALPLSQQMEMEVIPSPKLILSQHRFDDAKPTTREQTSVPPLECIEATTEFGNVSSDISTPIARSRTAGLSLLKEQAREELRLASAENAYAEHMRQVAKRQIELAEMEFGRAKRIRHQAQAELDKAQRIKEKATRQMGATLLDITCQACRQQFCSRTSTDLSHAITISSSVSHFSSGTVVEDEGAGENDNRNFHMGNIKIVSPPLFANSSVRDDQMLGLPLPFPAQAPLPDPREEIRNGSLRVPISRTLSSSVSSEITSPKE